MAAPLSSSRPAFPLASLLPAEGYDDYVHRCAVSMEQIISTCPQDGKCPSNLGTAASGVGVPHL